MLQEVTEKNFKKEILEKNEGYCLVQFYTPEDKEIKIIDPILELVSEMLSTSLQFYRINFFHAQKLAEEYGIKTTPTLLLFKKGKLINSTIGLPSEKEIVNWLKSIFHNSF